MSTSPDSWWRSAVIYQVYIRSFADGDGTGDLAGLRSRLPHLASLGVDAIWINPWYPSPLADGGYDVADYRDIHPAFGTLDEARTLITEAHRLGFRVILDIVPNHSSDQHPWSSRHSPPAPLPRPGTVRLPRRQRRGRLPAAQRLARRVRRPRLDPHRRRPVVPTPVRPAAARVQLGRPRGLFERGNGLLCAVNLSSRPTALPAACATLLASGPLSDDGLLPPDTTVWLQRD